MRDSDLVLRRAHAQQRGWASRMRDQIAWSMCNAILNTIATRWYRSMIAGSIQYGLKAAREDAEDSNA